MTNFNATYLPEHDLVFGGQNEEKDPCLGLAYFGPYYFPSETSSIEKIKLGIIGDKSTLEKSKRVIAEIIEKPIEGKESNKWLFPSYPGMSKETNFACSIGLSPNWQQTITDQDSKRILNIADTNERIGAAVQLYIEKIEAILLEDNPPDVILCCLPHNIEEHCGISERTRGAKIPKPTKLEKIVQEFKEQNQTFLTDWGVTVDIQEETKPKGYDFRNALKGKLMALKPPTPIQILRESVMDGILHYSEGMQVCQDPASFAWNFSTALLYKANGKPWRLAKLRQDTCYVGISFFRDKLSFNKDIQTSMAQVFTHNGEGLVLRGTEVYVDEESKEAHLSQSQAKDLLTNALDMYQKGAGRTPSRVVIHKSTLFTQPEQDGFDEAVSELGNVKRDFVTISTRTDIRFMRKGAYPILRGTLISLTGKEHLLYSSGYTPRIRTYPGHSIPHPLLITHIGDSEIQEIAKEILGLTKLNWNTTAFATQIPITLAFSKKVGQVLSELGEDQPLEHHYRFYM